MKRLLLDGPATLHWEDAPDPVLGTSGGALVRPLAVATCDLDVAVLTGRYPLPGPYPLGHEGVAEVVEVGAAVRSVRPGDLVIVPFQISCGGCAPCRRGRTGNCAEHPMMSTYGLGQLGGLGWGGFLADLVAVPHADAMLVPLPAGLDPVAVASASDNLPDAWRTVGPPLAATPAADVFVVGGTGGSCSIGLYAAGMAVALGAGRVVYSDPDPGRLAMAEALGATPLPGPPPRKADSFPVTVDASGDPDGLRCALHSTAPDGTCTSSALYPTDVALPLLAMYSRGLTFRTGRVHARAVLPAVLDLVGSGFDPSPVTATVAGFDDAVEALTAPVGKTVLTRV
jgi:threonine dehydrogenase-like Zn-dependent dehydrogenase